MNKMVKIQLCNSEEAKDRIKWMIICHGILWIIFGIVIIVVGDAELLLLINPVSMDTTHIAYILIITYSNIFYILPFVYLIATPIFLGVSKLKDYRRPMLEGAVSFLISSILTQVVKNLVDRNRPYHPETGLEINTFDVNEGQNQSMPSGHVSIVGAALLPHAIHLKNIVSAIIISLFSAGMMYVRMFLGFHYATDVLVGNILSVVFVVFVFFLFEYLYRKIEMKTKHEFVIYFIVAVPVVLMIIMSILLA